MKESRNVGYSKATISEEDGEFKITETTKDESKTYNLSTQLRAWVGVEGISITIKRDVDIPSEE